MATPDGDGGGLGKASLPVISAQAGIQGVGAVGQGRRTDFLLDANERVGLKKPVGEPGAVQQVVSVRSGGPSLEGYGFRPSPE